MATIFVGLHYGKGTIANTNSKRQYLWLGLRPFIWKLDSSTVKAQHKKHYFKNSWIKADNIMTVKDHPQNNSVVIIAKFTDNNANLQNSVIKHLNKHGNPLEPVLRAKNPRSKKTRSLLQLFGGMIRFAKQNKGLRKPNSNVVIITSNYKDDTKYAFAER